MDSKKLKPRSVTTRNKIIIASCVGKISTAEPVCVVGMEGNGITIVYEELIKRIKRLRSDYNFISVIAENDKEIENLPKLLAKNASALILAVYLNIKTDTTAFVERLNSIRQKRGTNFVPVVFADITETRSALIKKISFLSKSVIFLKPLDMPDTKRLINEFTRRFGYRINAKNLYELYKLGGGHVGLSKDLYFYLKENKKFPSVKELLNEFAINSRVEKLLDGLSPSDVEDLTKVNMQNNLLVNLGFFKDKKIFSGLLKYYLELNKDNDLNLNNFTVSEMRVFDLLLKSLNKLVSREDIALTMWKDKWETKYSEWAIDQIIHRIREKLKKTKSGYNILSRKKQGFILQEK